jgi:aminoglycoside phosphotransferase (APT) family kinase protein
VDLGRPIATGRDADIYAAGPGRVLRRTRDGRSQRLEARAMAYAREHGYPAPEVFDLSDDERDLVMQRIEGPTMLDDIGSHPWRMRTYARLLADLHTSLGRVPGPDWLPSGPAPGDRLVHLDLHPDNVLVTADGPVVIDWTNAARGSAGSDVATTWLLMSCAEIPGPRWKVTLLQAFRTMLTGSFIRRAGRTAAARDLRAVAAWKTADRNMRPAEVDAMRRFVERHALDGTT